MGDTVEETESVSENIIELNALHFFFRSRFEKWLSNSELVATRSFVGFPLLPDPDGTVILRDDGDGSWKPVSHDKGEKKPLKADYTSYYFAPYVLFMQRTILCIHF